MKSTALNNVLSKLSQLGHATKAQQVLADLLAKDGQDEAADETAEASRAAFDKVLPVDNRPDLIEQLGEGFFDVHTGLPRVAMENFPLPEDEDETTDADFV
jgi:hypothetical protein